MYGFSGPNQFDDFSGQFGHAAGRRPTRMGGGLAMPTPAPDAPDVSYPGMSFAPQQHQNPPPALGGPGAGSYPGMPGMGGPARDAGGLNPLQRSLFLRSVAFNNSGLSKTSDAGRDFLLAPFAGDNYTLNRGLATQQANDASDANAANVGAVNAGTQRTNTLTPLIGQGVATANRGQAIQNNLAEQSIPLITGNMQGQNQHQALQNQFYPGMAGADIDLKHAQADEARGGVGQLKTITDELNRHRTENQQLRAMLARYQAAGKGPSKDDQTNALIASLGGGGAAPATGGAPGAGAGGVSLASPGQQGGGKPITRELAQQFLNQAFQQSGGDRDRAKQMAKQAAIKAGYDPDSLSGPG
jgi:hypothetical protein